MEKLADALQKLEEDDLLKVVQMVHDHKTSETYVKNDVERMAPACRCRIAATNNITEGEFHVDLYTLPDHLVKMLWKFVQDAGALGV
jgi:transcription initiation factor IIF auxiliary subunit